MCCPELTHLVTLNLQGRLREESILRTRYLHQNQGLVVNWKKGKVDMGHELAVSATILIIEKWLCLQALNPGFGQHTADGLQAHFSYPFSSKEQCLFWEASLSRLLCIYDWLKPVTS